jgi:hypothetical protein
MVTESSRNRVVSWERSKNKPGGEDLPRLQGEMVRELTQVDDEKRVSMNMHIAHQLSVRGREYDRQRNERPHLMPMPACCVWSPHRQ